MLHQWVFDENHRAGRHADVLALLVPGVEVVAVDQLEGQHLRRLADLAGHLQQQRAGAAVAEIDDHVDVLGVAGGGRGRADADLDRRDALQRLALARPAALPGG